jgi:hypothetical protein
MRVVKCSLTNSALRPVSGWVRTTGWTDRFDFVDLFLGELGPPGVAAAQFFVFGEVGVFGAQALDGGLEGGGQGVPGGVLVGEQGVAAFGRQLLRMQQRAQAGFVFVREVGVPEVAGVAQAYGFAVFLDVGDHQDFRVVLQLEVFQHVDLQRAEAAAEVDVLLRRDALVAEHQHVVVQVGAVDAAEIGRRERPGEVQAQDFGAQRGVKRADFDGGGCVAVAGAARSFRAKVAVIFTFPVWCPSAGQAVNVGMRRPKVNYLLVI